MDSLNQNARISKSYLDSINLVDAENNSQHQNMNVIS